jgi:hypothetical protein
LAVEQASPVGCPVTVTVKLLLDMLPAASPALQVTVVVPMANVLPDGGLHAKFVTAT